MSAAERASSGGPHDGPRRAPDRRVGTVRMYPEPTGEVRMSLSLRFAAGSHKGMIREGNEDSGYAGPRLLAIADGMGGQAAGEVASSEVISTLVALDDDVPGSDILTSLGTAVQRANDQLRMMVEEDPQLEGMGTTLTALLWTGQRLGLVHVGDSRAYLLRDGVLTQITQDHTWVQRLVDEGRITEEEATTHPQRSLLMRALGSGDHVEPDLSIREVRAGDRYLICSDGLSGVVSHQTMEDTLASYQGPQETVQELIQLALRGGGPDNITGHRGRRPRHRRRRHPRRAALRHPRRRGRGRREPAPAARQRRHADARRPRLRASAAQVPGQGGGGEFGPPGSGDTSRRRPAAAASARYTDDDFVKPRAGAEVAQAIPLHRARARPSSAAVSTAATAGRRPSTSSAPRTSTSRSTGASARTWPGSRSRRCEKDHPEIELKYLPPYQQKQVKATIAEGGLTQAPDEDRASWPRRPSACKKDAERRAGRGREAERQDRRGRGRRRHGNHTDLSRVQGDSRRRHPSRPGRRARPVQVHDRTHSHTRPQPLRRGAEAGLAVR